MLGERDCRGGDQRDALVGGPEQHVELHCGRDQRRGVARAEHRGGLTVTEQARR